jgi:hypothetical protein
MCSRRGDEATGSWTTTRATRRTATLLKAPRYTAPATGMTWLWGLPITTTSEVAMLQASTIMNHGLVHHDPRPEHVDKELAKVPANRWLDDHALSDGLPLRNGNAVHETMLVFHHCQPGPSYPCSR